MSSLRRLLVPLVAVIVAAGVMAGPAGANHSWGGYHWGRTANPFSVRLGDNVSAAWDSYLRSASTDWTTSAVLDAPVVSGLTASNPKRCRPTAGRVEVCNAFYGNNGWLGIAQVWVSGSHITQGITKLNDTYFNSGGYNTPAWRQFVTCQEIGHTFGLGHQDEAFNNANLGSCMDYTNSPGTNQHPNQHDFDQLASIYSHVDSTNTVGSSTSSTPADAGGNGQSEWGKAIRFDGDGRPSLFVKELPHGVRIFTHVIWAR